jgi:hypothetical protein
MTTLIQCSKVDINGKVGILRRTTLRAHRQDLSNEKQFEVPLTSRKVSASHAKKFGERVFIPLLIVGVGS